jgi:hypothetical protein
MKTKTNHNRLFFPLIKLASQSSRRCILLILICISSPLACDDEVPSPPTSIRLNDSMRDASTMLEAREDYTMNAGTDVPIDMGPAVINPDMMTEPPCLQGSTRPLPGCGLERCLSGQWISETNTRELCNDHDDDCDGQVDESFSIGGMCFANNADGCQVEGIFICDGVSQAAVCMPSSTISSRPEVCDGIDNDCDQQIDEGFEEDMICCSDDSHCPPGIMCIDSECEDTSTPQVPIDPNAALGTCGNPIWMPSFNVYVADGTRSNKRMGVANCTGEILDDLLLATQTGLGSEVVFAFNVPSTQRVRFTTELSLFASVVYVFEGSCSEDQPLSTYCDQSILGLVSEPARGVDLTFEAQENTLYYVVLDTKLDIFELLELSGGGGLGSIPFVLTYGSAN